MRRQEKKLLRLRHAVEADRIALSFENDLWTVSVYWNPAEGSMLPEQVVVLGVADYPALAISNAERRARRLLAGV